MQEPLKQDDLVRFSAPNKYDHAKTGTRCIVVKAEEEDELWIQMSSDEENPNWVCMSKFQEETVS